MKQTAVEWLVQEANLLDNNGWILPLINQAKAMEKEQIMDAHFDGQCDETEGYPIEIAKQYYNETYQQSHTPKHYRVWFEDTMEEDGGYWWNAVTDTCGRLYDPNHPNEERDTVQWYIDNGYKVEEVTNG